MNKRFFIFIIIGLLIVAGLVASQSHGSFREDVFEAGDGFEVRDNLVYFSGELIEGIDLNSFEILHSGDESVYIKDKDNVYFKSRRIKLADPETFEVIEPTRVRGYNHSRYAKDKNNIYWSGFVLSEADRDTFQQINNIVWADKNCYYKYNSPLEQVCDKSISVATVEAMFLEDIYESIYSISDIEDKGIAVVDYTFGRDAKNVYELHTLKKIEDLSMKKTETLKSQNPLFPGKVELTQVVYDSNDVYWADLTQDQLAPSLVPMESVDRKTFTILPSFRDYSYDKDNVYFKGEKTQALLR